MNNQSFYPQESIKNVVPEMYKILLKTKTNRTYSVRKDPHITLQESKYKAN